MAGKFDCRFAIASCRLVLWVSRQLAIANLQSTICFSPSPKEMKRFHLIFGGVVILIFILTGQYMDKFLQHLVGMPDGPRMLYRTRHIYILLSGLLNLGIGTYFTYWLDALASRFAVSWLRLDCGSDRLVYCWIFLGSRTCGLGNPLVWSGYLPSGVRHVTALFQWFRKGAANGFSG